MKKKEIFSKLNVIDYNNQVEKVLENKDFTEGVKNILLNIFYKIENAYNDYSNVKREVQPKNIFIQNIIDIINNKCDKIKLIKPKSEGSSILKDKKYIVNKNDKSIISYPNETYIFYALLEIAKEEVDTGEDYIKKSVIDFFKLGNDINNTEVIRDFNGWSWSTDIKDMENIECNIIYQNIQLLLNSNLMQDFIDKKYDFELLKTSFYNKYEKISYDHFISNLEIYCLNLMVNDQQKQEIMKQYDEKEQEFKLLQNRTKLLQTISDRKKQTMDQIKDIDKILNDKNLLTQEYIKRNSNTEVNSKIFSLSHLVELLVKERTNLLKIIKKYNDIIDPRKFIERKNQIEYFINIIKDALIDDKPIYKHIITLQEIFLNGMDEQIKSAINRKEIIDLIYKMRYYNLIKISSDKYIKDLKEIEKQREAIERMLITKACKMKILNIFDEEMEINFNIIRKILYTRIINLENVIIEVDKDINIYDRNILEEKFNITTENIKKIKKTKLFN